MALVGLAQLILLGLILLELRRWRVGGSVRSASGRGRFWPFGRSSGAPAAVSDDSIDGGVGVGFPREQWVVG